MAFIKTSIGSLRNRVIIQSMTETQNSYGEMVPTWGDFANIWASVEPLRGREFWAGREQQARTTTRIRIRYMEGITPKMRVLFGTRIFQIGAVINPEEANIELQLMCEEWVAT